jgi:hypothetical protein
MLRLLERLTIDFNFYGENITWGASFDDIFDSESVWPQLRKLTLITIQMKSADFVAFAKKHSSSLKRL